MTPTMTQMVGWFDHYNTLVFRGELPRVKIVFNNTRRQLGQFYWGNGRGIGIKISLFYDRPEEEYKNTLVHEMCHLYCYRQGWIHEGHGIRWKKIAAYASKITGMNIQRCHEGASNWGIAEGNQEKMAAVQRKKDAPALLLDLDYGDRHFLVKTTKKVLQSNDSTTWDNKVKTSAKSYRILISDDPMFKRFQTSRSIHRGYKYFLGDYIRNIEPVLDRATEVKELSKLFWGGYDDLLS